nr:MAG TPA: hypothetical protein [Caudoviricetes sp.]
MSTKGDNSPIQSIASGLLYQSPLFLHFPQQLQGSRPQSTLSEGLS